MPQPGEIWLDSDFFDGVAPKKKYLLVLEVHRGDITLRYLTSKSYGRPEDPPCFHGDPYPGFYLGVLGPPLVLQSWLDLAGTDDLDQVTFGKMERAGRLSKVMDLDGPLFCAALRCVAGAPDTTGLQARKILDVAARRACP